MIAAPLVECAPAIRQLGRQRGVEPADRNRVVEILDRLRARCHQLDLGIVWLVVGQQLDAGGCQRVGIWHVTDLGHVREWQGAVPVKLNRQRRAFIE